MRVLISGGPAFEKIARAIRADEYVTLFPQIAKALHDLDLKVVDLSSMVSPGEFREIWRYLHAVASSVDDMDPELSGYVLSRIPQILPFVIGLDKAKPDAVVLHNDVEPVTKLAALWARERDVPCIHVPHAIYFDDPWKDEDDVHGVVTAQSLAAASPFQAEWYRVRSKDLEITITGAPRWDWIARWRVSKKRARELLRIPDDRVVITYATSWGQKTSRKGARVDPTDAFLEFLEDMKGKPVRLIAKVHPSDARGRRFVKPLTESGIPAILTQAHLPYVLTASDYLVAFGPSNILLEAAALGVPGVCHKAVFPHPSIFSTERVIFEELLSLRPDFLDLIPTFMGPLDGRAADRVASLVRGKVS